MRQGEYYRAYVEARIHQEKNAEDFYDVWIMIESARKCGSFDQLVTDSESLREAAVKRLSQQDLGSRIGNARHDEPLI